MGTHDRRSFLTALGMSGLLGTAGIGTGVADRSDTDGATASTATVTTDGYVLGVEVVNRETGERSFYATREAVSRATLEPGEYDVTEIVRDGDRLTQRTSQFTIEGESLETMATEEVALRVMTDAATTHNHVAPNDTVTVWAGAVEQEYGMARRPVENVELLVTLEDPDGNIIDESVETTTTNGNVQLEFDLDNGSVGEYTVHVESDETGSIDTTRFAVGPYTPVIPHQTSMTVEEQTTIGVYSELGGVPESTVDRELVVKEPTGDSQVRTPTFEDGVALLSLEPEQTGTYQVSGAATSVPGTKIESSELKALSPYFGQVEQYIDENVTWAAHVVQGGEPVSNLEVDVTVRERSSGDVAHVASPTTNEFGQFAITFDAPSDPATVYEVEIENDGVPVYLLNDEISFIDPERSDDGSGDQSEPSVVFEVSFESYAVGPGTEALVTVTLQKDGEPVPNATVTLSYSYGFNDVPLGYLDVKTDEAGTATHTIDVPESAPNGEWLSVLGSVELEDNDLQISSRSVSIERYDVQIFPRSITDGTGTIEVVATDRTTDELEPGIDVTAFGSRRNVDTETFDAQGTTTDANGEGQIQLDIPADATNRVDVRIITPYRSLRTIGGWFTSSLAIGEPTITPETPAPGETFTFSYPNDSETDVSAIVVCPTVRNGSTTIISEDESGELTVPADAEPGGSIFIGTAFIGSNGETLVDQISVEVAEVLTADFAVTPREPRVGEAVTFEDTSTTGPDAPIATYEWERSGGTIDETGPNVTLEFAEAGEYEITLTVTDEDGQSDETTKSIVVAYDELPDVDVTGDGNPATDTTGDGLLDDVNGDGEANIVDVQALFQNLETDDVQGHAPAFNFSRNDSEEVTAADVQALYERVSRYGGESR